MFTFCVILTDEMKQRGALFVKLHIHARVLYMANFLTAQATKKNLPTLMKISVAATSNCTQD
jgi:hypothetical protein